MLGVVGGLLAAVLWGASGAVGARAARRLGSRAALGWVYLTGLTAITPVALASGLPPGLRGAALGWLVVAVASAVTSLTLMYVALRRGAVVVITPILSLQGAVAAVIALLLGESLRPLAAFGLVACVVGTIAVVRRDRHARESFYRGWLAPLAALASAALGGLALVGTARAGRELGVAWLLVVLRAAGVGALTVPLALRRRLPAPGPALRLVVFCGLADLLAFGAYLAGTRDGIAVPAVISSQFAAVSVLIGVMRLGERLERVQWAGVAAILAGVAVVTAVQA